VFKQTKKKSVFKLCLLKTLRHNINLHEKKKKMSNVKLYFDRNGRKVGFSLQKYFLLV